MRQGKNGFFRKIKKATANYAVGFSCLEGSVVVAAAGAAADGGGVAETSAYSCCFCCSRTFVVSVFGARLSNKFNFIYTLKKLYSPGFPPLFKYLCHK